MNTKKLTLSFLVLSMMLVSLGGVSATHTSSVTITTDNWLKANTASTYFNVNVANDGTSSNAITRVVINIPVTYSGLSCGVAPSGWVLISDTYSCRYDGGPVAISGSQDFNLTVTTGSNTGDTWTVATKDQVGDSDSNTITPSGKTIQNAIDSATAGDTITIPAGTYTEDLVINTADITLESVSGKENTIIQLVDGVGIDVQSGASNFILGGANEKGFTILSGASTTYDIQITNAPSNVEISYNTINTTGSASRGISVGAAGADNLEISNNNFIAENGDGSIWGPKVSNILVSDNTFSGPTNHHASGYAIQFSGVTGTSSINDNVINKYFQGITISNGEGTSGLTISGNEISNSNRSITLAQDTTTTNGDMTTVILNENILSNSDIGIRITDGANVLANQFNISNNEFSNSNLFALKNEHSTLGIDAKYNNWGTVVYTEILALVSGTVNVENWLPADTTKPVITFIGAPYLTNGEIAINATITDERGLASYTIDFGDSGNGGDSFSGTHNTSATISEVHTYVNSSDYTVTITAFDEAGNNQTATTVVKMLSLSDYDWVIQLKTGWNLISIPYDLDDTSINTVLGEIVNDVEYVDDETATILQYDAVTDRWYKARPYSYGGGFTWGTTTYKLTNIKPGYAYWIKMENDAVLYGKKKTFGQEQLPLPSINLATGKWNLVGRYGVGTDNTLLPENAFVYDLTNNFYYPILKYDSGWVNATHINIYQGYWLRTKTSDTSTVTYEPGEYYL